MQTVEQHVNPRYWESINAFKQETGVPVVLNTSFTKNEPLVCTPAAAVSCLLCARMDALAIGNFGVEKEVTLAR